MKDQNTPEEIDLIKESIKKNIRWENHVQKLGGQQCGTPVTACILICDELFIKIEVGFHRSQLKNKELAYTLFELALDELIK